MTIHQDLPFNINRPPKEILIDKYNQINGTQFNPDEFVLSDITTVVHDLYNTTVTASPLPSSVWTRGFPIHYSRNALEDVFRFGIALKTQGFETLYPLLPLVNQTYGINLTEADVEDTPIIYSNPANKDLAATVTLVTKPTSYMFTGTVDLSLNTNFIYGLSSFETEALHFLALRGIPGLPYQDTIQAYNSLGALANAFVFCQNVHLDECVIEGMWKTPIGQLIVSGEFIFTDPSAPSVPISASSLTINNLGAVVSYISTPSFGYGVEGLERIPDAFNAIIWAIDHQNQIGGSTTRIHRYFMDTGIYSNFNINLPNRASALAPVQDALYVATFDSTNAYIDRILLATRQPDPAFTRVVVSAPQRRDGDSVKVTKLIATDEGVYFAYEINSPEGETPYLEDMDNFAALGSTIPCFAAVGLSGGSDYQVSPAIAHHAPKAFGAGVKDMVLGTDRLIYSTTAFSPFGYDATKVLSLDFAGVLDFSIPSSMAGDYKPSDNGFSALQTGSRGVAYHGHNHYSAVRDYATASVDVYSADGYFSGNLLRLEEGVLLAYAVHVFA